MKTFETKIYFDIKKKVFCRTAVPLKEVNYPPVTSTERMLSEIRLCLLARGYKEATRSAFEAICK